ncbi:uncharacterized protein LOC116180217 [Photinus pyralis]|uniref:uncharacterized protein LOC116180217 n=1 Tax=Photinus pyralis TaxID=7054 RepID=UPI0012675500|nr:uncharacterized protein LOC116180217 [Photinus pyralis]
MKLLLVLFSVIAGLYTAAGQNESKFVCKNGVSYIENFCNQCGCNDGNLVCTKIGCSWSDRFKNCTQEQDFYYRCGYCQCVKDLGFICSRYRCPIIVTETTVTSPTESP